MTDEKNVEVETCTKTRKGKEHTKLVIGLYACGIAGLLPVLPSLFPLTISLDQLSSKLNEESVSF